MKLLNFKFIIMKKNYFFVALFALAISSVNAQFVDDMESYTVGSPISGGWWTDWGCGGGAGCAIISSDAQAQGGGKSGYIPDDGTTDAVLDLGNKIFGSWGLEFYMYVPSGKEGYFNLQGVVPIGAGEWIVGNVFFNQDTTNPGVGLIDDAVGAPVNFNFPHDQWFRIAMNFDINLGIGAATWGMSVDNEYVIGTGETPADWLPFTDAAGTYPTSLGGFDFFSISANNQYWLDTFNYQDSYVTLRQLSTSDFAKKGFSAYPNPVNDRLNIQAKENINSVVIYNVLGQQVYSANVDALQSSIDMSRMASGAYFVKVNINGTEGTVKVIK
ncbi:MAG: T9SS type A sorting domain-containing protein [Flavobacteriaceae bacterium]